MQINTYTKYLHFSTAPNKIVEREDSTKLVSQVLKEWETLIRYQLTTVYKKLLLRQTVGNR